MTGWLVDWPARTLFAAVYALLTEGAGEQKDIDEFDERLYAPLTGTDRARERGLLAYAREVLGGGITSQHSDRPGTP